MDEEKRSREEQHLGKWNEGMWKKRGGVGIRDDPLGPELQ